MTEILVILHVHRMTHISLTYRRCIIYPPQELLLNGTTDYYDRC